MWQHDCDAACCSQTSGVVYTSWQIFFNMGLTVVCLPKRQLWCVVDQLAHMFQHSLDCCLVTKQKQTFVLSGDQVTLKFA